MSFPFFITNFDNNSHRGPDVKGPRLTSFDLKTFSKESSSAIKTVKSKNKLKGGGNVEMNEKHLQGIVHNNYF